MSEKRMNRQTDAIEFACRRARRRAAAKACVGCAPAKSSVCLVLLETAPLVPPLLAAAQIGQIISFGRHSLTLTGLLGFFWSITFQVGSSPL